jgi:hypothetical protein
MTLAAGTRLGPYEIQSAVGAWLLAVRRERELCVSLKDFPWFKRRVDWPDQPR